VQSYVARICNDCANVTSAGTDRQKQLRLNKELLDCARAGNFSAPVNVVEVSTARRSYVTSGKNSRNPEFISVRVQAHLAGELALSPSGFWKQFQGL
jgi:hypothetical protein